jgi:ATP-dependent RNA helicase SUPV3L1/SUV3
VLDRALDVLDPQARRRRAGAARTWFAAQIARHLPALAKLDAATRDPGAGGPLRALAGAARAGRAAPAPGGGGAGRGARREARKQRCARSASRSARSICSRRPAQARSGALAARC